MPGAETFELGLESMLPIFSGLELDNILRVSEIVINLQPEGVFSQP
jgi:hypothetical protein